MRYRAPKQRTQTQFFSWKIKKKKRSYAAKHVRYARNQTIDVHSNIRIFDSNRETYAGE